MWLGQNKPEFSGRFLSQRLWGQKIRFHWFSLTAAFLCLGRKHIKNKVSGCEQYMAIAAKAIRLWMQVLNTQITDAAGSRKEPQHVIFYESTGLKQTEKSSATSFGLQGGWNKFCWVVAVLNTGDWDTKNYLGKPQCVQSISYSIQILHQSIKYNDEENIYCSLILCSLQ